jgi:3-deoxy-D-manno-octulosonic-acid transferase
VSGIFRKNQPFFKNYGSFHRKMLKAFTHFFVQNKYSSTLLRSINISNVSVCGDTRFDRVLTIAERFEPIDAIHQFCSGHKVIVAGSTWSEDDEELNHFANTNNEIRFIIAPHDINTDRLEECQKLYKRSVLYSSFVKNPALSSINTLIIDNIGMLSRLYNYATICFIGGAFGEDGVHNVLEAAVYYKPIVFGPIFSKYAEAVELIDSGGAFSIHNAITLEKTLNTLFNNEEKYLNAANAAGNYVRSNTGATEKIMNYIQEKRLLTN